jgi:chemotaxis response regulator CheB
MIDASPPNLFSSFPPSEKKDSRESVDKQLYKILIIQNNLIFARILKRFLTSSEDFRVVGVLDQSVEASSLTAKLSPEIVLLDLESPIEDGLAHIIDFRNAFPTTVLIVLSTLGVRYYQDIVRSTGADAILDKAEIATNLFPLLYSILESKHQNG